MMKRDQDFLLSIELETQMCVKQKKKDFETVNELNLINVNWTSKQMKKPTFRVSKHSVISSGEGLTFEM